MHRKDVCPGCDNQKDYRAQRCNACYRASRRGKPLKKLKPSERFWPKVEVLGPQDCWLWTGCRGKKGYGKFYADGHNVQAHRFSYLLAFGPIPEGKLVLHECDNPPCVNPLHLKLGTCADNTADMVRKGRSPHREGIKLTARQVLKIREEHKADANRDSLATRFGVTPQHIGRIVRKTRWTWL